MLAIALSITLCAVRTAREVTMPSHMYVRMQNHEYRIYLRTPNKRELIYSEPFDEFEAFLGEFAIAELWPAPNGKGFVFVRHFDSRTGPNLENRRLTQYNVGTKVRATLFGEDVLPSLDLMRSPGFLVWKSNTEYSFGINRRPEHQLPDRVELCSGNLQNKTEFGETGEIFDSWESFLAKRLKNSSPREIVKLFTKRTEQIGKLSIEFISADNRKFAISPNKASTYFVSVLKDEIPDRISYDGNHVLVLTLRRLRPGLHSLFADTSPAENYYRSIIVDVPTGKVIGVMPDVYMVRCLPKIQFKSRA